MNSIVKSHVERRKTDRIKFKQMVGTVESTCYFAICG